MFIWLGRNHSFLRQSLLFLHSQCWKFHTVLSSYLLFYCLRSWTNSVTVSWRYCPYQVFKRKILDNFVLNWWDLLTNFLPASKKSNCPDHAEKLNNKIMQIWNITLEVCTWKLHGEVPGSLLLGLTKATRQNESPLFAFSLRFRSQRVQNTICWIIGSLD